MKNGYKILIVGLSMESYVLFVNLFLYIYHSHYCGTSPFCVMIPITPYTSLVGYLVDTVLPLTLGGMAVLIVGIVIVFWNKRNEPTVDTIKKSTDVLSS